MTGHGRRAATGTLLRAWGWRLATLAVLWWALAEGDSRGWGFGVFAVVAAATASFALRPAGSWRITLRALSGVPSLAAFFVRLSILGGLDVARRALHPRLPVDPGFVEVELRVRGSSRALVIAMISLLPGTVGAELRNDRLVLHVLDRVMPAAANLAEVEERLLSLAAARHGPHRSR